MGEIRFPYEEFRAGQKELSDKVYEVAKDGGLLVVKAPTGYGKTAAILYGVLRAEPEWLLYAVRTINEIDPVIRELKRFGTDHTFLFSAKKSCPLIGASATGLTNEDFWENCRLARLKKACRYYDRVERLDRSYLLDYLKSHYTFHALRIARDLAKFLETCPFFSLRSALSEAGIVVATYPYLFRKDIFETVLEQVSLKDAVVVVDEAHSLLNIQDMFEERINKRDLEMALQEARKVSDSVPEAQEILTRLKGQVSRIQASVKARVRRMDKSRIVEAIGDPEILGKAAELFRLRILEEALLSGEETPVGRIRSRLTKVYSWSRSLVDDRYYFFVEKEENNLDLVVKPLDPSAVARDPLEEPHAAILLSGTMPPLDFTREVLGVERPGEYVDVELVFGAQKFSNAYTVVSGDVTTAYRERSTYMYGKIAQYVSAIHKALAGVKLAVYPSYEVMKRVVERLDIEVDVIVEDRRTSMDQVEDAINTRENPLINAVAGGKLVEGVEFVDYEGNNLLHVVIVVGVPFPQPDDYTLSQLEVLSSRIGNSKAREYVYRIMPLVKVRQALGRAIRSPGEKALFFLLDYRYLRRDIKGPLGIRYDYVYKSPEGLYRALDKARRFLSPST